MSNSVLFLYFIIYSAIGWISEVVYCSLIEKKFVNRGFLRGPLCPIYGFGGLLVVFALEPFAGNPVALFFAAAVLTTALEYATGWALEAIFNTKWWDYSRWRFNLHGRICLVNSLMFGVMGFLGVYYLHPLIERVVALVPPPAARIAAAVLFGAVSLDFLLTLRDLVNFADRLAMLGEYMEGVRESIASRDWFDELDLKKSLELMKERVLQDRSELNVRLAERLEFLVQRSKDMRRLMRAFPGMRSRRHNAQLDLFKKLHRIGEKIRRRDEA